MAGRDQRAVNRARRAARASARGEKRILPISFSVRARAAQEAYVQRVISGEEPEPRPGSPESKVLGRWASLARWNKADTSYETAFKKYWYHRNDDKADQDNEDADEE
jgi:hypothetical protein